MARAKQDGADVRRVGVREFRGNFSAFMREAQAGQTFLITSHDEILAEIRPPSTNKNLVRHPGALRGKIRIAADFDVLPLDVLAAMLGDV